MNRPGSRNELLIFPHTRTSQKHPSSTSDHHRITELNCMGYTTEPQTALQPNHVQLDEPKGGRCTARGIRMHCNCARGRALHALPHRTARTRPPYFMPISHKLQKGASPCSVRMAQGGLRFPDPLADVLPSPLQFTQKKFGASGMQRRSWGAETMEKRRSPNCTPPFGRAALPRGQTARPCAES